MISRCHIRGTDVHFWVALALLPWAMGLPAESDPQVDANTDAVVDVIVEQSETVVYWNGEPLGAGSRTVIKPPGEYNISVVFPDGFKQDVDVTLKPGEIRQLTFALATPFPAVREKPTTRVVVQRPRGRLLVIGSRPDTPVALDGKNVGRSSLYIGDIACGSYQIKVGEVNREIRILPDWLTVVQGNDVREIAQTNVAVYDWIGPAGLTLFDEESAWGELPISVGPIEPRARRWRLKGAGAVDSMVETPAEGAVVRQILVQMEAVAQPQVQSPEVKTMTVARAYGTLVIAEAGSKVSLDQTNLGIAPLVAAQVLAGPRKVSIDEQTAIVEILPNRMTCIRSGPEKIESEQLENIPALGMVVGNIPGLKIRLAEGSEWVPMRGPYLIQGFGERTISLRGMEFEPQDFKITLTTNQVMHVNLVAEPPETPRLVAIKQTAIFARRAYGKLVVSSETPGMPVVLNGVILGETTLQVENVLAGEHQLAVGPSPSKKVIIEPNQWTILRVGRDGNWSVRTAVVLDDAASRSGEKP